MKHLALLLFSLVCYTSPLLAQDFWEQLYFPDSLDISCLAVNSQGNIFVGTVSQYVTNGVYRSNDAGISWELALNTGNFGVLSLEINSEGTIYAGTNRAYHNLWVSYNSGNDWQEIPMPYNYNIPEIHCQESVTIYASLFADNGALLVRSSNGGADWEELFATTGHPGEYISDIEISNTGIIYISLMCFFQDMGGVFRSTDNGLTWEYIGLLNHQIRGMAINSNDDVFTSDWYTMNDDEIPGIYALYQGNTEFELKRYISDGTDIVIDPENHIYVAANESMLQSDDNGETFNYIDDPLSQYIQILQLDDSGYLYGAIHSKLVRSIYPTITSQQEVLADKSALTYNYPNPFSGKTTIHYNMTTNEAVPIAIKIFDRLGKMVKLLDVQAAKTNINTVELDMHDLPSGMYYYSLFVNDRQTDSKKMVVVR
jgi:hypothetical protein